LDAAWAAAGIICGDLIAATHKRHFAARRDVWRKGYCLLCDVDGVLYVYARKALEER
jgi:hypothetical protein